MNNRLIVKVKNEDEFKKIIKCAKKQGYGFQYNIRKTTYKGILSLFKKEINNNIKIFCLIIQSRDECCEEIKEIEYQTINYCKDFYYSKVYEYQNGIEQLKMM